MTVTCVDDDPIAVDDTATVTEDDPATPIDVLANDTDVDNGPITVDTVTQPDNGTVVITNGGDDLTYQPDPNYCNSQTGGTPDTFTYTLDPGGSTATVHVTVTCVTEEPVAVNDTATVNEDSAASTIAVLANDADPDSVGITIDSVTQPANGTVVITSGGDDLTYEPDADFCGADTFTYTIDPGGSTATVSVTVTCVDDDPIAVDDTATVAEDAAATSIDVLANDTDVDNGAKTIDAVTQPDNGTVVITGGGSGLTYQPNANYCNNPPGTTPDTFTYTLTPGDSTATVSVTVTCVDDAPVAVNDAATVLEDAGATPVNVLANDTDVEGDPITIASVTQPANGTVAITGGGTALTYQPNANHCNNPPGTTPDTFSYTVNGGDDATVSVTVTCVDDPPVAVNDTATVLEDAAATAVNVLANDTDVDGGPKVITAITQPTNGSVVTTGGGTGLTYQPNANYCNNPPGTTPDTFTYTITGGDDATVSVTVTCVDDPPVAVNDSATVLEDAAAAAVNVLANDTDIDAGPTTVNAVTQPTNGSVVITGGGTGLTYQPNANYCNNPPGTTPDTFTYTLNGGSTATVSMTVTCVNDNPVADNETFNGANSAVGNTTFIVNDPDDGAPAVVGPNKTVSGDLLDGDSDIDGPGPLVIVAGTTATADGGSVTIQADGDFTYTPVAGTSCTDTTDSFAYTVSDQNPGTPGTATGTVTITISGCVWYVRADAPAAGDGRSQTPFNTLTAADTAATGTGQTIYVFRVAGDSGAVSDASVDLLASQTLLGSAVNLVVDTATLYTGNDTLRPSLTSTSVKLDDGNIVRGLSISGTGSGAEAIEGGTGDVAGTLDNLIVTGTTGGIELNTTSGTFNVSNLTITTTGGTGVALTNAGTVNFASAGTITISSTGGKGLDATGTSLGTSTFDTITVTSSGTGGVSMTNTTGTTTFAALDLTTTSGANPAFLLNNAGTVTVADAGTANVSATGGPAVDVTATAGATLAFDAVTSTNSANDGINLAGLAAGTFTAGSGSMTGATGIAFDLDGGSGTITYPGNLNNGSGASVEITGRSGGTVTLSGQINDTNDAGGGITLTDNTGGTTNITNATKTLNTGASPAVTFTTSNGHTLNLTGGSLDIDTTSGQGINANDAGTITITGTGNTITTTSGTALDITTTDIGATGATFQSISANGAPNGIVLNGTGSGALTVTGDGTLARNGSGGTINNTSDDGVRLTNANNVTLQSMNLTSNGAAPTTAAEASNTVGADGEHTVQITGGSNVVLSGVLISASDGSGYVAHELGGTNRINSSSLLTSFPDGLRHGIYIDNNNVNMPIFEFHDSTINNSLNDAAIFFFSNTGTSNMTLDVEGSTFENLDNQALTVAAGGLGIPTTGTLTSTIGGPLASDRNLFQNARHFNVGGVDLSAENNVGILVNSGATHNSVVENNVFDNIAEDGTIANTSVIRTQNSGGVMNATVRNNTIQNINFQTGAGGRHLIGHVFEPAAFNAANSSTLNFVGNTASNITFAATMREMVFIDFRPTASGGNVRVTGNNGTLSTPGTGAQQFIELRFRRDERLDGQRARRQQHRQQRDAHRLP